MAINLFIGSASTNNWNVNANWSLGTYPIISDGNTASFNVNSGTCTSVSSGVYALDFTGYNKTFNTSVGLNIGVGGVIFSPSMSYVFANANGFSFGPSCSIKTNGATISCPLNFSVANTYTLIDDLHTTETFTSNNAKFTGANIYISATLSWSGAGGLTSPNTLFFVGNKTNSYANPVLNVNTVFNKSGGILTISNLSTLGAYTFTYTSGIINHTGTFTIANGTILNTYPILWNNITQPTGANFTINSPLLIGGTFSIQTTTINGISGFSASSLLLLVAGSAITLQPNLTYSVSQNMTFLLSSSAARCTFKSASPGTQSNFILQQGATQLNQYVNAIDINSSAGQTIWSWQGTFSNVNNWMNLTPTVLSIAQAHIN